MTMSLSDKSSETSTDDKVNGVRQNGNPDDVCRDYLRNVCKRGKRCRYSHPDRTGDAMEVPKQELAFCHDYQNTVCKRPQCKFVHCTREEEEYFRSTGQLPPTMLQQNQIAMWGKATNDIKSDAPICKDYLKGECKRAGKCKYKHLSNAEFDYELRRLERSQQMQARARFEMVDHELMDRFDHEVKRRRMDYEELDRYQPQIQASRPFTADYKLLEEENLMLRRRIEELRKQVTDLAATNEVLLDQNARFRVGKSALTLPVVTSTTLASVVTGQVVTPTISPAPIVASSITVPRMPVLHSSLTRQIPSLQAPPMTLNAAMTTELAASQQAIHQQIELAQELARDQLATQQANMNPVQDTLSAAGNLVSTLNAAGTPVSITHTMLQQPITSISRVSVQQSMPQSSIPQGSLPQIRMSGPVTAPMVTYPPIMSHGGHRQNTSMS